MNIGNKKVYHKSVLLIFIILIKSSCFSSKTLNYELVDLTLVITFEKKEENYTYYSTHFILGEDEYNSRSGSYIKKAERGNIINFFEEYSNLSEQSEKYLSSDILNLSEKKKTIYSKNIYSFLYDETFIYIAFNANATLREKKYIPKRTNMIYTPSLFCDSLLKNEREAVQLVCSISQLSNIRPITKDLIHKENFILMPIDSINFEFCTK